jgi:hypothetical protein
MVGSTHIDMHNDPVRYRDGELKDPEPKNLVPFTPFALRSTKIDDIQTRPELIKELTKQIPSNEFGLPQYYYRPDLLDVGVLTSSMKRGDATFVEEMLQAAVIPIWYTQGFPTIGDNCPAWGQLPFETKEAHQAFLAYAEQTGVRQIHRVDFVPIDLVTEWFHLYYWTSRAKSFDMFRVAHHARMREHRIMNLEDNHFVEGEKIFKRIAAAIGNKTEEELGTVEIDKLIIALERVSRLQRASVGLGTSPAATSGAAPKTTSVEFIMKEAAKREIKTVESEEFDVTLLQDPDLLRQAQELIIKVTK